MKKLVKDVMNKQPKMITPDEPIHKAAAIMHKHNISHLPVVDNDKQVVVGHVHTNDVLKAVAEQKPHTTPVKHIMNKPPVVLPENTPIPDAATMLAKVKVKGAPTINEKGELSGFVHVRDIEEKVPNAKPHVDQILNATKHHPKKAA
jgi:acetoin utilization protein AcuB